jgi:multisubunit Na+/H+ antiporter MnhG subunit
MNLRWMGIALACGGALTFLANALLTPFLPTGAPYAQIVLSPVFPWRIGVAAIAAALLLFGSVGVYLAQAQRIGRFGAFAFVVAFLGTALLLATEWIQLFDIRDIAFRAPDTLNKLNARGQGPSLGDVGALIALSLFTLGWIMLAIATVRARAFPRNAAILVIAGFFAIPMLQAPFGITGAILGNFVLGAGFFQMGRYLAVNRDKNERTSPIPSTAATTK